MLIFEKLAYAYFHALQSSTQLYSQTQASIPTLELQSSSTLGTGKAASHRERLDKIEDIDARRSMDGQSNKRRRRNNNFSVTGAADTEDEDAELDVMGSDDSLDTSTPNRVQVVDVSASLAAPEKSTQSTIVGSALRRNPDGTFTAPRIVKRKKTGQKVGLSIICGS